MIRSYMTMMVFALFRPCVELPILASLSRAERYTTVLAITYFLILSSTEIALQSRVVDRRPYLGGVDPMIRRHVGARVRHS
jgi:hypothetical protein